MGWQNNFVAESFFKRFAQQWLEGLPSEFHEAADQACLHFLDRGEWPEAIDEVVRLLLVLRCLFAIDHVFARVCRGELHPIDKGGLHIELYLVEQWHREYVSWLRIRNPNGLWNFPFDPWGI